MAVAFDAAGGPTHSSTSPLTWGHIDAATVTAFLNLATTFTGSSNVVTADTYASVAATLLAFQVSGGAGHTGGGIALYYLGSPATGNNTASVTFTGAADTIGMSVSATGSASHGTVVTGSATAASSVSVTVNGTTTGGLIVVAACYGGGSGAGTFSGTNSVTVEAQQTVGTGSASDNAVIGTVASTGGGANQTVGFSNSAGNDNWGIIAVELLPPGTVAGKTQPLPARPAPRRKLARAAVYFAPVRTTNAPPFGQVQPWPTVPVPRRKSRRAVVQFTPVRTTNAPPFGTVQPWPTIPVPRRRPSRATARGIAVPGVIGTVPRQPSYLAVPPRRRPARAVISIFPPPGPQPPPPPVSTPPVIPTSGGDHDVILRVFREIRPGDVPDAGAQLPRLTGRAFVMPVPADIEHVVHAWETEQAPVPPEPGLLDALAEVRDQAAATAGQVVELGRIFADPPYQRQPKKCGAIRKIGGVMLTCRRKPGHAGTHSDRGLDWR